MQLLHTAARTRAAFDEPNLIAHAGLVPVMRLAGSCGLEVLAGEQVKMAAKTGANAGLKIAAIVAGMAAGADSIDGLGVLRHGAMSRVFGGIRAPSTLGSFLRGFTWGSACQVEAVSRQMLARLAREAPVLPGADVLAVIDIDSVQRQVHGPGKQGAGFGHAKVAGYDLLVRGLNALIATVSHRAQRVPGDRLHQAARRQRRLRPGRGPVRRRGDHDGPLRGLHRAALYARRFGVLREEDDRGVPEGRGQVLLHRQDGPRRQARHRGYP